MRALSFILVAVACPPDARAAGGHHAVDDAAILEPGQCLIETWFDGAGSGNRRALHFGPACRLGAVELTLNADRLEFRDRLPTLTVYSPQIKWATEVTEHVAVGVVLTANYQNHSPHRIGYAVVLPLSWQASRSVAVHLNAGRDFHNAAPDATRAGAAVEWSPLASWSFVAERYRDGDRALWRLGARYVLDPALGIDLGYARPLGALGAGWWTLGLNWTIGR